MSFESGDIDELGNYVVEDISLDFNLFNILVDLSENEFFLKLVNVMEYFEIGEFEEYWMEFFFDIVSVDFFRIDFLIDDIDVVSFLILVLEVLEWFEILRIEEYVKKFVVEVMKIIVSFCNEDSNV